MNKYWNILAGLSLSLVATCGFAQENQFERVLNSCLARPGASIVDCARVAALSADFDRLDVTQEIDLATGESKPQEKKIKVCDEAGGAICHYWNCYETDSQSVCDHIGWCNDYGNGACWWD